MPAAPCSAVRRTGSRCAAPIGGWAEYTWKVERTFGAGTTGASKSQWYDHRIMRRTLPLLLFALTIWTIESLRADGLACLQPVSGVTWLRWEDEQETLDRWCQSVGPPVFAPAPVSTGDISRLLVLSWNVHVGGADTEELIERMLVRSSDEGTGVVLLLQEAFRAG